MLGGDGGELLDDPAAAGAVPGQTDPVRRDVVNGDVTDVGTGVERGHGQRQHADTVTCGNMLELFLDGMEHRLVPPGPHAQLGGDVAPLGDSVGVLEQVLVGEVGDADGVLSGQAVTGGQHGDPRLGVQLLDLQALLVYRQAHEAHIHPAVVDDAGLVVPGRPDHVHDQPGMTVGQRTDRRRHDEAGQFFALRYFGALAAVHAAAPHIRPGGSITLTTGTAKDRPGPGWSVVASICGAMEALTKALAVELAPIRVNAVCPGVVRSPLWDSMPEENREQLYWDTAAAVPLGRVGNVSDIAQAYLFYLTQQFATGSILTLDGGAVLA